ncbi:hypothetical protein HDIA_1961 [Hartmannibacter diazotrophicus]|uniref:Heme exporter protein D n=1 Tax=Hartmannibacter diazotrophicus TaxID=1482074 RepID=A0A2C9D585_9HYPH|nr:hypothetical protein HDIA_1961 [Hartmannibacter diazotrophicus]
MSSGTILFWVFAYGATAPIAGVLIGRLLVRRRRDTTPAKPKPMLRKELRSPASAARARHGRPVVTVKPIWQSRDAG